MAKLRIILFMLAGSLILVPSVRAEDKKADKGDASTVDLRGKKGVVDPSDLKKSDPPERSLKIKEPPPPYHPPPPPTPVGGVRD